MIRTLAAAVLVALCPLVAAASASAACPYSPQAYGDDYYPSDWPYAKGVVLFSDNQNRVLATNPLYGRTLRFWVNGVDDDYENRLIARDWGPPNWGGQTGIAWSETSDMFSAHVKYWDGPMDLSMVAAATPVWEGTAWGTCYVHHTDISFNMHYYQPGGVYGHISLAANYADRLRYRRDAACHETGHAVGMGHDRAPYYSCMEPGPRGTPSTVGSTVRQRQLVSSLYTAMGL